MTRSDAALTPSDDAARCVDWSQWTVVLLKPDCLARNLTGPVLALVGEHVRVTAERIVHPAEEQVFTHYADLLPLSAELGVDVAAELRRIYLGHPVMVALGYGPGAAARLRAAWSHRPSRGRARDHPGPVRHRHAAQSACRGPADRQPHPQFRPRRRR
jgi:nucleoside-diphosphate kinase